MPLLRQETKHLLSKTSAQWSYSCHSFCRKTGCSNSLHVRTRGKNSSTQILTHTVLNCMRIEIISKVLNQMGTCPQKVLGEPNMSANISMLFSDGYVWTASTMTSFKPPNLWGSDWVFTLLPAVRLMGFMLNPRKKIMLDFNSYHFCFCLWQTRSPSATAIIGFCCCLNNQT